MRGPLIILSICLFDASLIIGCAVSTGSRSDGGAGADSDTDTDTDADENAIFPDCSDCENTGVSLVNMICAIDLCYGDEVIKANKYTSPTADVNEANKTYEAVARFGEAGNGLAPLLNGSYALMATGTTPAGVGHNVEIDPYTSVEDPVNGEDEAFDVMEWKLKLKAPAEAEGFKIHYVFLSSEYDEFVSSNCNDKFYIILEAQSTNNGQPTIINFTKCRQSDGYKDGICSEEQAKMGLCVLGENICYMAVNTAYSECCWYDGCPDWDEADRTDLSGTGFGCAPNQDAEWSMGGPDVDKGYKYGSSTGWLKTEWPIEKGEEFEITFHIHDTADSKLDSEVIIDKFLFVKKAEPGTAPVK